MTILSKIFLTTLFILLFDRLTGKYVFNSKHDGLVELFITNEKVVDILNSILGIFLLYDLIAIAICILQFIWTGEANWFFIK